MSVVVPHREFAARWIGRHLAAQAAAAAADRALPSDFASIAERHTRRHLAGYVDAPAQTDGAVAVATRTFSERFAQLTGHIHDGGRGA